MAEIRGMTERLIESLMLDQWPTHATVIDFGIKTPDHLGALQFVIKHELRTPEELDAALGSGEKLTALCVVPGQPYPVTFDTAWDHLGAEGDDDADIEATLDTDTGALHFRGKGDP